MRISGGSVKGRRTATRRLLVTTQRTRRFRPTSSKVREALFDILRDAVRDRTFVDLYAGTGTVGFEAISRGAAKAVFVEADRILVEHMRRVAADIGCSERVQIFHGRAETFISQSAASGHRYAILYLDPPYQSDELERILPLLGETDVLEDDGVVVVEHFVKKTLPERFGAWSVRKRYRYGDTALTVYRRTVT